MSEGIIRCVEKLKEGEVCVTEPRGIKGIRK